MSINEAKNLKALTKQTLFEDPKLRYFFEVSLPAANQRTDPMGHVLVVCPDAATRAGFVSLLQEEKPNTSFRAMSLPSDLKPGDLGAIFTNLGHNDMLLIENDVLSIDQSCVDVFKSAMMNFYIDIIVGKGPSANSIRLDLPAFTVVMCVEKTSKALAALYPQFEYVIRIDEDNLPALCKAKLKATCPVDITDESCEYISAKAKYDLRSAANYLNRILEYLQFKHLEPIITRKLVEDVFALTGIGDSLEDPINDDEIYDLFRDIRNSLRDIQDDIHSIRNNMEDFIAANSGDWQ